MTLSPETLEELKRIVAQHPGLMAQLYTVKLELAQRRSTELIVELQGVIDAGQAEADTKWVD